MPSDQKFWFMFGGLFATVGGLFLVLGIAFAFSSRNLVNNGLRADGEVVDLIAIASKSEGKTTGWTWHPKVRFVDETGRTITFISSSGSKPPAYNIGERAEVIYHKGKSHDAVMYNFFSLWGIPLIGAGLGLIMFIIGIFGLAAGVRSKRRAQKLAADGNFIDSDFTTVERISDDDGVYFFVRSQWLSPSTHQMHVFESQALQFDPSEFVRPGQRIRVRVDRNNPSNYQMDMSFLPTEANH